MRTSLTDPLQIAVVSAPGVPGAVGLTLCPGKKDWAGGWDRDLEMDIAAIRAWGAEIVVTLVENREFLLLDVVKLPESVSRHGMKWVHLPIRDVSVPDETFEANWQTAGAELRRILRAAGRFSCIVAAGLAALGQ